MTRRPERDGRRFWPVGILFVPLFGLIGVIGIGTNGVGEAVTHHWWWGIPFLGPLGMLFGFLAVVALVVWFTHWLVRGTMEQGDGAIPDAQLEDRAVIILRERFARGEIDEDEYLRRLRVLEENSGKNDL
ncbi:MAG: hypothetical protein D6757_10100 [Alphaproteobacteria bacterium]|nr:MAG: hypothetical protein D6757_10100 [Alphaproteobacteria bacterium]